MKRIATLQVRADEMVLWSYSQTSDGLWIALGPVLKLPKDANDEELVLAIRTVLAGSLVGVQPPQPFEGLKHVLAVAGVKSERAFNRGSRAIGLKEEPEGRITLNPERPEGGGWVGLHKEVILDSPTTDELARPIRRAIETSVARP